MKCRVELTGQGENQKLKIWVPLPKGITTSEAKNSHREYIQRFLDEFVRELDQCAEAANLPLRMSETWYSYHLSIYGKEWVFQ